MDLARRHALTINLDITFPSVPCAGRFWLCGQERLGAWGAGYAGLAVWYWQGGMQCGNGVVGMLRWHTVASDRLRDDRREAWLDNGHWHH